MSPPPDVGLPATMPRHSSGVPSIGFVASYPPRECGIATFTRDTRAAVLRTGRVNLAPVVALNEPGAKHAYPPAVEWQIARDIPASYDVAAEFVNGCGCQVINVQHEYGLFGGEWGSMLFRFLDRVTAPVVLTLHTVLPNPDTRLREITRSLIGRASRTVVLAHAAIDILETAYGVDRSRLRFVPHGVPDVELISQAGAKHALGLDGRSILTTCGLMNRGKGIEVAIDAIAGLVDRFPDLLYVVAGQTHPGVRNYEGESYRDELSEQVQRLGLEHHVRFENRYLSYRDLVLHLLASDVYLVPYLNLNQIVSGTLAYALGCGRAIVSTPSIYTREVLADQRGLVVGERDPGAIAAAVAALLSDPELKRDMEQRAYALGHSMIWPKVAEGYLRVFNEAIQMHPRVTAAVRVPANQSRTALQVS